MVGAAARAKILLVVLTMVAVMIIVVTGAPSRAVAGVPTTPPTRACPTRTLGTSPPFSSLDFCAHNHGDTNVSSKSILERFSTLSYAFASGDYLEYDVHLVDCLSDAGGLDVIVSGGTTARSSSSWQDQNGLSGADPDLTPSWTGACTGWYHRALPVPSSLVGQSSTDWLLAGMNSTPFLTYRVQYANVLVTDGSGHSRSGGVIFNNWPMFDWNQFQDYYAFGTSDLVGDGGNADAALDAVTSAGSGGPSYLVRSTTYPSPDVPIAGFDASLSPWLADPSGASDSSTAIQEALNDCYTAGGGTVWLPVGQYLVTKSINVPPHCTLRGDWHDPSTCSSPCTAYGSTILAEPSSGSATDPGLIRVWGGAGVEGLTFFYPNQLIASPTAYPYTIELLGATLGNSGLYYATVKDVTLLNSYRGISDGVSQTDVVNEGHEIQTVYGTALSQAMFFDNAIDLTRTEDATFGPAYWSNIGPSVFSGVSIPTASQIASLTRVSATGLTLECQEQDDFNNLTFHDFNVGIQMSSCSRIGSSGNFSGLNIDGGNIGFLAQYVDQRYGLNIQASSITANTGTNPTAFLVGNGHSDYPSDRSGPSIFIRDTTLGGGAATALAVVADDPLHPNHYLVSCVYCTFDSWTGAYAVTTNSGVISIEHSNFAQPLTSISKGIDLGSGVTSAVMMANTYTAGGTGAGYLYDSSTSGQVSWDDTARTFYAGPAAYSFHSVPEPASNRLFNVSGADPTGASDSSSAIQNALNDAGTPAGVGGTVYLPPGTYSLGSSLTVPAGVELRGTDEGIHKAMEIGPATGTILLAYVPTGSSGTPLIVLNGTGAGVRGLGIDYPEQATSASSIVSYPWAIQGRATGVYAYAIDLVNAYQGIDFATYNTSGHYIGLISGLALQDSIDVASGGAVEDILLSINGWAHAFGLPNVLEEGNSGTGPTIWNVAQSYQLSHGSVAVHILSGTGSESVVNAFVYSGAQGIVIDGGTGMIINAGQDTTSRSLTVTASGSAGYSIANDLGSVCSGSDQGITVSGGTSIHMANIQYSGCYTSTNLGMNVTGGVDIALSSSSLGGGNTASWSAGSTGVMEGVYVRSTSPHVTVTGSTTQGNLWGNIGNGTWGANYTGGAPNLSIDNIGR